jgi:hypothetical protein
MSGDGLILRLGEFLVGCSCQFLPEPARSDRYREWTAELPYILSDARVPLAAIRSARMLLFALDHSRATCLHRIFTAARATAGDYEDRLRILSWVFTSLVSSGSGALMFFLTKGNMTAVIISVTAGIVGGLVPDYTIRLRRALQRERDRLRASQGGQ